MTKSILYLGTDPSNFLSSKPVIHYPIIKIAARKIPQAILDAMPQFTHVVFTSKNAVAIFFDQVAKSSIEKKVILAVGKVTGRKLTECGVNPTHIAKLEQQEGIIALMDQLQLEDAYLLLPRSSLARGALEEYLVKRQIRYQICDLYDTVAQKIEPVPDLDAFQALKFLSVDY